MKKTRFNFLFGCRENPGEEKQILGFHARFMSAKYNDGRKRNLIFCLAAEKARHINKQRGKRNMT